MPQQIAILGWGSLLWDKRPEFDDQHEPWQYDGPELRLEFSRVSQTRHGALTLVIDANNGAPCRVAYATSKRGDPAEAISDLRNREGTGQASIGVMFTSGAREQSRDPDALASIQAWASAKRFDVVVWTDLASNFEKARGRPFDVRAALEHIQALGEEERSSAMDYVRRAPSFVDTPLRRALRSNPAFSSSA